MLTELYIEALLADEVLADEVLADEVLADEVLADEVLADEVWALWNAGAITDELAAWAWWHVGADEGWPVYRFDHTELPEGWTG